MHRDEGRSQRSGYLITKCKPNQDTRPTTPPAKCTVRRGRKQARARPHLRDLSRTAPKATAAFISQTGIIFCKQTSALGADLGNNALGHFQASHVSLLYVATGRARIAAVAEHAPRRIYVHWKDSLLFLWNACNAYHTLANKPRAEPTSRFRHARQKREQCARGLLRRLAWEQGRPPREAPSHGSVYTRPSLRASSSALSVRPKR